MYTKHLTIYQGLNLVNFFLKTIKWIELTLTTGLFNSFNIQNSCSICFQCVCLYECMCLCLCPSTSGLLLSRMIPETRMKVQVNDVMLRTLMRCLYQFPLSSNFLHLLPYFTSKTKLRHTVNWRENDIWWMTPHSDEWNDIWLQQDSKPSPVSPEVKTQPFSQTGLT